MHSRTPNPRRAGSHCSPKGALRMHSRLSDRSLALSTALPSFFSWSVTVFVLFLLRQTQAQGCDVSCQAAQQQALASLYTATKGPEWAPTSASALGSPVGWLNTTAPDDGRPAHCAWSGMPDTCLTHQHSEQASTLATTAESAVQVSSAVCHLASQMGSHN